MFSVIFEVLPNNENWDDYLDNAKTLRPELEQVEGFVDNIRYKSLTREGWILSLSNWRDEKSLVRWRTHMRHHEVQQKGRDEILADYHLRVGQITADNQVPGGYSLKEQRLDETEVGDGTTVTLINATCPAEWKQTNNPYDCAEWLGLNPWAADSMSWDIFDALLTPGDLICSYPGRTQLQRRPTRTLPRRMTRRGSGECGSCATTGNTTVARRLSITQTPGAARPSTPDRSVQEPSGLNRGVSVDMLVEAYTPPSVSESGLVASQVLNRAPASRERRLLERAH